MDTIKKYRVMQDITQNILLGDFDTLRQAREFFKVFEFDKDSEAWIQTDEGKVVQCKSVVGDRHTTEIGKDDRPKWMRYVGID